MSDNLPEKFQTLQTKIIERRRNKDFEDLLAISYYHHMHSSRYSRAPLFADNNAIEVGVLNPGWAFRLSGGDLGLELERDGYSEPFKDFLNKYLTLVRSSFSRASVPLDEILLDAMTLEILALSADIRTDQETIDHLRKDPGWYIDRFFTDGSDSCEYIKEYYRSAVDEILELKTILQDCTVGAERARSSREVVWWTKLTHTDSGYNRFCEFVDRRISERYSFVLKYLDIEMPALSSGEQALQNIFAWLRLPPSFDKILGEESVSIQDNILLLLDEADLYMHPEWQRKFLKYLSDELALEYPNKYVQIIISTHSPLVLSDIPSGNIIYLEKNDEKCAIAQRSEQKESFGANIFSLLKDSFFLKRSLGEFAYSRISEMIKGLEQLEKRPDDQYLRAKCVEYRHLIDIIGEPVLRRKLQMMYDDIFGSDAQNPDEFALERVKQLLKRDSAKYRERLMKMLSDTETE